MDHRATSIAFLRSTGLTPVKVPYGGKAPFPDWDPRKVAGQDHSLVIANLASSTELNLGALFHGRFVDIDVDTDDKYLHAALDYFLPKTPFIWGRAAKRRSHRVYALNEDFDRAPYGGLTRFLKNLKIGDPKTGRSLSVEVRGGKPENGLFTVLPGSWREDAQEMVEWEGELDPTVTGAFVPIDRLLRSLRIATATALIAAYWGPGVRNEMSLALAGMLWRIRSSTLAASGADRDEELDEGFMLITENDAESMLHAIMKFADDTHGDERARVLNFKNTWKKLDGDPSAKVTGGKVLAELIGEDGAQVTKALYRLLSDNEGIEALEALTEQFVMWYGQGVVIDLDLAAKGFATPWMAREATTNSLGGKKIQIGDKKIPIANILFGTTLIQRAYGLTFDPSQSETLVQTPKGLMVNQWKGFSLEPSPQSVTKEQVEPFLDYVYHVLACKDEAMYRWILAWCADILQNPGDKTGTSLVLVGVQGAGKSFLGERVLGRIIGPEHYMQVNSIEALTDKFNSMADNKIFLQCDEAVHSYQRTVAAKLKSIITDETMTVEPKGINSYKKPNHMRLLFTSNEENTAIFIDPSPHERRFTVQKVSNLRAADVLYWTEMRAWTELNLPKIMRYLLDYSYDRTLIRRPLMTKAKVAIQRVSADAEVAWIVNRIASGFILSGRMHRMWFQAFNSDAMTAKEKETNTLRRDVWPDRVLLPALEADFKAFVREQGRSIYSGSVITVLKRALPEDSIMKADQPHVTYFDPDSGQRVKDRIRLYSFPPISEIMEHLRINYGAMIDDLMAEVKEGEAMDDRAPEIDTAKDEY